MWQPLATLLVACSLPLLSAGARAAGLIDAYQAARQNEPTFRAARYERDAGQYAIAIGRAGLLPIRLLTPHTHISCFSGESRF